MAPEVEEISEMQDTIFLANIWSLESIEKSEQYILENICAKYCTIFAEEYSVEEEKGRWSRRGISNFPAKYRVCSGLQDQ